MYFIPLIIIIIIIPMDARDAVLKTFYQLKYYVNKCMSVLSDIKHESDTECLISVEARIQLL